MIVPGVKALAWKQAENSEVLPAASVAVAVFSAPLLAQNQGVLVPLNNGSIDYITQVTTSVNNLVTADAGMFVSEGISSSS